MPGSVDVAAILHELVQQQTAFGQQQVALLQLQSETVRLQRLLVERALGVLAEDPAHRTPLSDTLPPLPAPAHPGADVDTVATVTATPVGEPASTAELPPSVELQDQQPEDSPVEQTPRLHLVATNSSQPAAAAQATEPAFASRGTRYFQPRAPRAAKPVTRQDVDRVTRLYEAGDAAHLVLQFGEYKGVSMVQVAEMDPDYVRGLALTAQRPQVRAAARQLVVALEASEQAAQRSRPKARRVRADGR